MDELIRQLRLGEGGPSVVTLWSVLIGCGLSGLLSLGVALLYRRTNVESTYSQALARSFVVMSMVTALIMLVIGSNIARAFSLVGALSIVRFRTAIKSPMDIAFLFLSMAIGMACGTRFYMVALVGFGVIALTILGLHGLGFASYPERREHLLSVAFHMDVDYEQVLGPVLDRFFDAYSLAYVETVRQGTLREVVYSVRPREGAADKEIVDALVAVNDNLKVSYRSIRHAVEVP